MTVPRAKRMGRPKVTPVLCDACNVCPEWPGEHRCCGGHGFPPIRCECSDPLCRMQRGEVTLAELQAEDAERGC